jgi:ATP/maltotriose-dependent transcriptional regulator MalT
MWRVWYFRGSLTEGCERLAELQVLSDTIDNEPIRVRLLQLYAWLARRHGAYTLSIEKFDELLRLRRESGDRYGAAFALSQLANVHYLSADFTAARAYLKASQATAANLADAKITRAWRFVGGQVALHEGRYAEARALLTDAFEMADNPPLFVGYCLMNLGTLAREVGDLVEAERCLRRSLDVAQEFGDRTLLAHTLEGIASVASSRRQHARAVRLGGAAEAQRGSIGGAHSPAWVGMVARWLDVSRTELGEADAAVAWQSGLELPFGDAVTYAREPGDPVVSIAERDSTPASNTVANPLTRREREVAALIARGLSNKQIARQLVITDRTVASHVEHILDKLGFASRTQIGIWAVEHDLAVSVPNP